ncbi:hypothetical protein [Deinococcus ruber]|uniref:Holin n=1 Tax=Deinococcus ruber TaxID=1848197 RepID=A0A918FJT3_9DEIO|nr:hypothetical protein [Deinococcus ruber]GGR39779.1 hypothetical protein GCM10008957_55650 [Deinococcus ruber]
MTAPVKAKPFWQSKTFWAAVFAALIGGYRLIAPNYHWDIGWVPAAEYILTGLGLWGIRTANTTIGQPTPTTPDNVVPSTPAGLEDLQK